MDGEYAVLSDGVAGVHILVAPLGQKLRSPLPPLLGGEGRLAHRPGGEYLEHLAALPGDLYIELAAIHQGGEAPGGELSLALGAEGEDVLPQPQKGCRGPAASASETWGSPSSILGVRPDRWSEKGPS